ncbi:MAG: cytochrome c [Proteobacteria bacterium]|nr:MAG: cytochrome c [Pseudomonadota bacterium]
MKALVTTLIAGAALVAGAAHASKPGNAEAGKEKAQTCVACHGQNGVSETPIYPILANQYRDYLVQALKGYRSGERNNAIMRGFASGLSDEDILDLALYFSEQSSRLRTPSVR